MLKFVLDGRGQTALMHAIGEQEWDVVRLLIEYKANVHVKGAINILNWIVWVLILYIR